jgi:serine phosphatase RsbU (regulator of sigma subunit)
VAFDDPDHNEAPLTELPGRSAPLEWISRAVDWTRRTLHSEFRDPRELAQLLEEDREEILRLWAELALAPDHLWSAPPNVVQDRQVADLCLARLLGALDHDPAAPAEPPEDEERFSFAATLAEYGAREAVRLDDLIQYLLVLRRAIHLYLRRYGGVNPSSVAFIDRFLDTAVVELTRSWLSASQATVQWEETQLTGLLSVSQKLLSTLDPASASNALTRQAQELAEADGAVLLAVDALGERLEATAAATITPAVRALPPQPIEICLSGEAIRLGQIVTTLDVGEFHISALRGLEPLAEQPAAAMSAPVWLGGQIVGALEVASFTPRIYTPDQMKMLAMLAAQAGLVWENVARRRQVLDEERARTLREIEMAQKVQRALLSASQLERGALSIGACLEPSREVGGDYYDFFVTGTDTGQVAIHLGDVSGKGIPAALLVAMAKYVLRSHALPEVPSPGAVLQKTNETFCSDLSAEMAMFITAIYALVDEEGRELRYSSAGHPAPLIVRGSLMQPVEERSGAAPLNLVPEQTFPERLVALCPGDLVLFYTDGVLEARNAAGEWFGLNGLRRALRHCRDEEPQTIARFVVEAVRSFQGGQPLADDTTVVVLKIRES